MTERENLRHITAWLASLANLTAGTHPLIDAKVKLAAYASVLAEHFPPQAFTPDSLHAVATTARFFPTYGEVYAPLTEWWREHRPKPRAIPQPPPPAEYRAPPTDEERAYVRKIVADLAAELRARPDTSQANPASIRAALPERPPARLTEAQLAEAHRLAGTSDPRDRMRGTRDAA